MDTLSGMSGTSYELPLSEADAYIFRMVRQACVGHKTAPWAFHVVGPGGTREVTEHQTPQDPAG
jgi:hypothetical protein